MERAVQRHSAGRLPRAEDIYQQMLQADADQPAALHLLGVIAHQTGKNDIAVDFITRAVTVDPDYAEAHCSLGNALKALGKLDEAVASYRKAFAGKPCCDEHCARAYVRSSKEKPKEGKETEAA